MTVMNKLTGRTRHRVNHYKTSIFGSYEQTLVLQVEVHRKGVIEEFNDCTLNGLEVDDKYWRDARVEDLTILDINLKDGYSRHTIPPMVRIIREDDPV